MKVTSSFYYSQWIFLLLFFLSEIKTKIIHPQGVVTGTKAIVYFFVYYFLIN
jgi:hypothetical protein